MVPVARGLLLALLISAPSARAQEVSAQDQQSASAAFDRATARYLARDYAGAAQWFETAHRLAPAAGALIQAVRSHHRAGNAMRAATLALRLQALYGSDPNAARAAQEALAAASQFFRVDVHCTGCTVQLDGRLEEHPSFYVEPGVEHTVVASFETGTRTETVRGAAGQSQRLAFEAPAAAEVTPDPEPEAAEVVTSTPGGGGIGILPWPIAVISMAATAGVGAVLIWSGVDTLDGVPAYEANPTAAGLADGRSREERTNWLIAGTAAAGAVTLVLSILTDWGGGGAAPATQAACLFQEGGGGCSLRGRF